MSSTGLWPRLSVGRDHDIQRALVAYIAALVIAGALGAAGESLHIGVKILLVDATLLSVIVVAFGGRLSLRCLGIRKAPLFRSVTYGACALVVLLIFDAYWSHDVYRLSPTSADPLVSLRSAGVFDTVLTGFAVCISAPVVEEIFFRGMIYSSLRERLASGWAAMSAGAMFGLAHVGAYPVASLPAKVLFGIAMCVLYEMTGSILPTIAVHSFVDSSAFDITVTKNDNAILAVFGLGLVMACGVALVRLKWSRGTRGAGADTSVSNGDNDIAADINAVS